MRDEGEKGVHVDTEEEVETAKEKVQVWQWVRRVEGNER